MTLETINKKGRFCYNKADWTSLHVKLASITDEYFQINEANSGLVQENWKHVHENLMQAIEMYIPTKYISNTVYY